MNSETAETANEHSHHHGDGSDTEADTAAASNPLTIDLPDGTANVAEAIQAHRDVLHNPSENGLASDEDISHLSEAVGELSGRLQEAEAKRQEAEAKRQEAEAKRQEAASKLDELELTVSHQQRQIQELHAVVKSLVDILGTSTEWESFESETANTEHANE